MLRHFDSFSGYGGFALGVKKAMSSTLIGFSENDEYALKVLKYHWPEVTNYGDISKIDWSTVPDFDLLTGGSPCQDLSIAGKRAGLGGARSGLFYEFVRTLKEKKPAYFIWENVKGALSSQGGWDFAAVLNEMAEAGYSLWWQVLNAKDFGVPQNRERVFVVGFRDRPAPEVFFEREDDSGDRAPAEEKEPTSLCLTTRSERHDPTAQTLIANALTCRQNPPSSTQRRSHENYIESGLGIRRFTPTESERLFGLPDGWTSAGGTISDAQRYKMCGNGVVVSMVEALVRELIPGA